MQVFLGRWSSARVSISMSSHNSVQPAQTNFSGFCMVKNFLQSKLDTGHRFLRQCKRLGFNGGDRVGAIINGEISARPMVTAEAATSKWEFATGAGRLAVPVNNSSPNLMDELSIILLVITEKSCGQPVVCVIGFLNSFIEIFDPSQI